MYITPSYMFVLSLFIHHLCTTDIYLYPVSFQLVLKLELLLLLLLLLLLPMSYNTNMTFSQPQKAGQDRAQ